MNTSNSISKQDSEIQIDNEYNNELNHEIEDGEQSDYGDNNSSGQENSQDMMGEDEDDQNYQDEYDVDGGSLNSGEKFDDDFSDKDEEEEDKSQSVNKSASNLHNV